MMTLFSWYVSNNGEIANNPKENVNNHEGMWPIAKVRLNKQRVVKEINPPATLAKKTAFEPLTNKRYFT